MKREDVSEKNYAMKKKVSQRRGGKTPHPHGGREGLAMKRAACLKRGFYH